jgi:hypothetical protein
MSPGFVLFALSMTIAVVLASMTAMAIATWIWRWMVGR